MSLEQVKKPEFHPTAGKAVGYSIVEEESRPRNVLKDRNPSPSRESDASDAISPSDPSQHSQSDRSAFIACTRLDPPFIFRPLRGRQRLSNTPSIEKLPVLEPPVNTWRNEKYSARLERLSSPLRHQGFPLQPLTGKVQSLGQAMARPTQEQYHAQLNARMSRSRQCQKALKSVGVNGRSK